MVQGPLSPYSPAAWAQTEASSRGRRYSEPEHPYRSLYARDRDRIIHCRAFRRLEYKTQVFVNHEGDHYRTRLTHSLEVSQIARTVARALNLNADLAESIALCHDLGHTPFGHLGEDVLGPLLADCGGFDHNRQALRIVEKLENRYPRFPGLNLTWEVREGIVKHSGLPDTAKFPEASEFDPRHPPPLEAQMIDLVDEIAYNHHDLEDGLESELLDAAPLAEEVPLFGEPYGAARAQYPDQDEWMWIKVALRDVIDRLVTDLIETTRDRLKTLRVESLADVKRHETWIVGLSDRLAQSNAALKRGLRKRLYRHPRIEETRNFFACVLTELFGAYSEAPAEMPPKFAAASRAGNVRRIACDYIAGMTDRFALLEHRRLCGGPGPNGVPYATK